MDDLEIIIHTPKLPGPKHKCFFCSGYLLAEDVVDLSLAYSTVYHLGLDQGGITAAVNTARSVDIRQGLVNIDTFIHFIQQE